MCKEKSGNQPRCMREDDACGLRCCGQKHWSEQNVDITVKWHWEDKAAWYRKISHIARKMGGFR